MVYYINESTGAGGVLPSEHKINVVRELTKDLMVGGTGVGAPVIAGAITPEFVHEWLQLASVVVALCLSILTLVSMTLTVRQKIKRGRRK